MTRTARHHVGDPALRCRIVRWERLFADLEAQLAATQAQEARVGLAQLVRAERASTRLADRLRASVGLSLRVQVGPLPGDPDAAVVGDLLDLGVDWVLVAEGMAGRALVPLAAVQAVTGLAPYAAPPQADPRSRLGLSHALRALSQDRATVAVSTPARTLVGRLDRVGADHVEVTAPPGPPWTVPIAALRVVRSR